MNLSLKEIANLPPDDYFHVFTVDGRTGEVLCSVAASAKFFDDKRSDVIDKVYERARREILLKMENVPPV